MSDTYRDYFSWEEAIRLSQKVHELIESLPDNERSSLAVSLNSAAVNLPTTIALNLVQQQPANIRDLVSLQTQLELVDRIYPALDTAEVTQDTENLLKRLQDPATFRQTMPKPAPEDVVAVDNETTDETSETESPPPARIDVQSEIG